MTAVDGDVTTNGGRYLVTVSVRDVNDTLLNDEIRGTSTADADVKAVVLSGDVTVMSGDSLRSSDVTSASIADVTSSTGGNGNDPVDGRKEVLF